MLRGRGVRAAAGWRPEARESAGTECQSEAGESRPARYCVSVRRGVKPLTSALLSVVLSFEATADTCTHTDYRTLAVHTSCWSIFQVPTMTEGRRQETLKTQELSWYVDSCGRAWWHKLHLASGNSFSSDSVISVCTL